MEHWPAQLHHIQGHEGDVTSVTFSPDGLKIVSGSDDQTIRVWDAITGTEVLPLLDGLKQTDNIIPSDIAPLVDQHTLSFHNNWFINTITCDVIGGLPIEIYSYYWSTFGSYAVGWSQQHQLILMEFSVI